MKICLGVLGLERLHREDPAVLLDLVRAADRIGVDQISVADHVVMGDKLDGYPYGPFPGSSDAAWPEPVVQLAAFAAVTERARLSSGIIITPLRPAALLAKQIATLDVMSKGRVDLGVGVGWQKEEYEACGAPWTGRFTLLEEQMRACRLLWSEAPASFHGKFVNFEQIWCRPFPAQGGSLPLWFGLAPSGRNLERIAELGDGWLPMERDPALLAEPIRTIKNAMAARGRDPETLAVRATYRVVRGPDGKPDLSATLAQTAGYAAAGVTMLRIEAGIFCRAVSDFAPFLERVLAAAR
jgi:probable F420-dependent oxidoreductase